jgi:hypothetical protein
VGTILGSQVVISLGELGLDMCVLELCAWWRIFMCLVCFLVDF